MKTSPRKAIRINCKECIYDPEDKGTWLEQVEACTIIECIFYEHRPLTGKTKQMRREKELALLSPSEREIAEEKLMQQRQNIKNLQDRGIFKAKSQETQPTQEEQP